MSYRIEYGPESNVLQEQNSKFWTLVLMTLTVFALFLSYVHSFHPDYWTSLQEIMLPGDAAVTRNALKLLIADLRSGITVSEAAVAFCTEIFLHASIR